MPTSKGGQDHDPLPAAALRFLADGPPPPRGPGWLAAAALWGPLARDGSVAAIAAAWRDHREQIVAAAAPGRPWCELLLLAEADADEEDHDAD